MAGSVTGWLESFKYGNDDAAHALWDRLYGRLCRRIAPYARSLRMSDDEDIASGTFAEFCDAIRKGQFENVTNRTELWKLLATIAVRKTRDCHKYENAMRRGGGIERYSFDELRDQNGRGKRFAQNFDVPCPVVERNWDISIADLQKSIADEGLSEVLRLKVQGLENREIARQIGCSLRTIQYMVRELTVTVLAWGQAEQLH